MTSLFHLQSPDHVARIRLARAMRRDFFKADLFSDPAWDILLVLYAKHLAHERVSLVDLAAEIDTPFSTVRRWLRALEDENLVSLSPDGEEPQQRIALSPAGSKALHAYFRALRSTQPL